jgi:hypothetical protein
MARSAAVLLGLLAPAAALDDGLCRTPIMGMNSWTAFGASVTEADLLPVGKFFVDSGMRDASAPCCHRLAATPNPWLTAAVWGCRLHLDQLGRWLGHAQPQR